MSNNRGGVYEYWVNCVGAGFIVLLIILGIMILPSLIPHLLSLNILYAIPIAGLFIYRKLKC